MAHQPQAECGLVGYYLRINQVGLVERRKPWLPVGRLHSLPLQSQDVSQSDPLFPESKVKRNSQSKEDRCKMEAEIPNS